VLFFIGAALFVITFLLNLAGQTYVNRLRNKLKGGQSTRKGPDNPHAVAASGGQG
jgi:hypothetical protein